MKLLAPTTARAELDELGETTRAAIVPVRSTGIAAGVPIQRSPAAPDALGTRSVFASAINAGIAPVQRDEAEGEVGQDHDVHGHAQSGVAGGGQALPHLEQIQTAFGRHDVRGVQAHVGGQAANAAAAIGANAYATGNAVAFAGAPDLRLAAHEAAHVVQQRGGVSLAGGVGEAGDRYEQHADEVAAHVVRGDSAEGLLDAVAGDGGDEAAVQGDAIQRDPETLEQLQAAVAATEAAQLRRTLTALDRFRPREHETRREVQIPIGGMHRVRPADIAALRTHVLTRLRALGAVRDPAGEQAIIDAAIRAIEANESGGRETAPESAMDTSAPNPREPHRGQHASYASASQMIPSHAIGSLRGSEGGRELAAEHGLDEGDLGDARDIVAASNRVWDAVVREGWTYERLAAHRPRRGASYARDLETTGFTTDDIARMEQFAAFRNVLRGQRERVLAVRAAVTARFEQEAGAVDAQIAALRAEAAGPEATGPETPEVAEPPDEAPVEAAPPAIEGADDATAAIAGLSPRLLGQVAGCRAFARPARWDRMTARQRRQALDAATRRARAARGQINHVASAAADALIASEVADDPGVAPLHFDLASIRAYIHSESHFLERFNEDRGGWSRRALQNRALDANAGSEGAGAATEETSGRSLDDAISAAAADEGGHRLTRIDLESGLRTYLASHPAATDDEVVRRAADINSGGNAAYRTRILGIFRRQATTTATTEATEPTTATP